jgi:hypothetical protein
MLADFECGQGVDGRIVDLGKRGDVFHAVERGRGEWIVCQQTKDRCAPLDRASTLQPHRADAVVAQFAVLHDLPQAAGERAASPLALVHRINEIRYRLVLRLRCTQRLGHFRMEGARATSLSSPSSRQMSTIDATISSSRTMACRAMTVCAAFFLCPDALNTSRNLVRCCGDHGSARFSSQCLCSSRSREQGTDTVPGNAYKRCNLSLPDNPRLPIEEPLAHA